MKNILKDKKIDNWELRIFKYNQKSHYDSFLVLILTRIICEKKF